VKFSQDIIDKATVIAEDCQGSHAPFCNSRCPMHTDVKGYVGLIGEGKLDEAMELIREKLFLPGTLGRICAHPCEVECRRGKEFSQPIAIAGLKRYAADYADLDEFWDVTKKASTGKKVGIIGAGPAGAQAAIDMARAGHAVVVFDKAQGVGGMMRYGIPEYRLPRDIIDFEYTYLGKLGIELKMNTEIGKDIQFAALLNDYDAVIVAIGAQKGFVPEIKGHDAAGVTNAAHFLANPKSVGEKVVVIGGGDVAMDCARTALRVGATDVSIVCLEKEGALPASHHELVGADEEGVAFNYAWGGQEITTDENGAVTGIILNNCISLFDAEGRFAPTYGDERKEIPANAVIFATGQIVADATGGALEQGRGGRYNADKDTLATANPKVFVAGDCAGGTIVVEAMALGRKAAKSADRFLTGQDLSKGRDFENEWSFESKLELPLPEGTADLPRRTQRMLPADTRKQSFVECCLGFWPEDAKAEANRCLECECKGCMSECIMLNEFTPFPGELFEEFLRTGKVEPLMVYSCNMCDQCTLVCPKDFKFAELFGAFRREMVTQSGGNSPMPGHKAINMHQKLGFSKMFTTRHKGGKS